MFNKNDMANIIQHCSNISYEESTAKPSFTKDKQVQHILDRLLTLLVEIDQKQAASAFSTIVDRKNSFPIFGTSFLNLITVSENMDRNLLYISQSFIDNFLSEKIRNNLRSKLYALMTG